jgi:hypothetical protein
MVVDPDRHPPTDWPVMPSIPGLVSDSSRSGAQRGEPGSRRVRRFELGGIDHSWARNWPTWYQLGVPSEPDGVDEQ